MVTFILTCYRKDIHYMLTILFFFQKWMKSIHIDAFFDYLLSRPNEYYQEPDKNPIINSDQSPTPTNINIKNDDDEYGNNDGDLVLKLIKRSGSKRQKRKYTRRNTIDNNND